MCEGLVVSSKMFIALLTDLKKSSKLLKAKVKKCVRDRDPDDMASCLLLQLSTNVPHIESLKYAQLLMDETIRHINILPQLNVGYVADALTSPADTNCFKQHLLMLAMISDHRTQRSQNDILTEIRHCQNPSASDPPPTKPIGKMLRDSYAASADLGMMLENTKIGSLAKEIAGEVDVSAFTGSNMSADMFSLEGLTNPKSPLAGIVQTVGSKIQSKIASGELKQEDLLAEAIGMLKFVSPEMLSMFSSRGS